MLLSDSAFGEHFVERFLLDYLGSVYVSTDMMTFIIVYD